MEDGYTVTDKLKLIVHSTLFMLITNTRESQMKQNRMIWHTFFTILDSLEQGYHDQGH